MTLASPVDARTGTARRPLRREIPWGYGVDRLAAAAVDTERLFACWEVTDRAIARATAALGRDARDVELCLRVYDTTNRLFDGSNAHRYFDQRVQRSDRQWFFTVGRPSSSAVVEIGVRSSDGRFAKIARSKRVDFPRKHAASWRGPEWMTVRGTGEIERTDTPARPHGTAPAFRDESARGADPSFFAPIPLWVLRDARAVEVRRASWETVWQWSDGAGWLEPVSMTTWTSGPFSYPVEMELPSSRSFWGGSMSYRVGEVIHIVDGPWQVVIRNLGATRERTVISRWQMARSWVVLGGRERRVVGWALAKPGASELLAIGASEHAWLAGSEMRLGGASERFRLGASELRFGGASERLYAGASQWMMRGASERRLAGASEGRLGASERRLAWTCLE